MIYDDYYELEEELDFELEDDEDTVVVVCFEGSSKRYHYFTDDLDLKKGDRLRIKTGYGKETTVTVIGYTDLDDKATKSLHILNHREDKEDNSLSSHKKKSKTKLKKEAPMKRKLKKATDVALDAAKEARENAIYLQKGNAVIIAVKTAIYASDAVPIQVKKLIESGAGISDLLIGLSLEIAAKTFTESETIQSASECANFSGAISASSNFTFIQDAIEKIVVNAVGVVNEKTNKKEPDEGIISEGQDE